MGVSILWVRLIRREHGTAVRIAEPLVKQDGYHRYSNRARMSMIYLRPRTAVRSPILWTICAREARRYPGGLHGSGYRCRRGGNRPRDQRGLVGLGVHRRTRSQSSVAWPIASPPRTMCHRRPKERRGADCVRSLSRRCTSRSLDIQRFVLVDKGDLKGRCRGIPYSQNAIHELDPRHAR